MDQSTEIQTCVEAYAKAWADGDLAAVIACYGDAFTLHYGGRNALSGDHIGKAAALGALADFQRRTKRRLVGIVDVMAGARRGVVIAREALGHGAARVEIERTLVYRVESGQFAECWVHDADQGLIDRLIDQASI